MRQRVRKASAWTPGLKQTNPVRLDGPDAERSRWGANPNIGGSSTIESVGQRAGIVGGQRAASSVPRFGAQGLPLVKKVGPNQFRQVCGVMP